MGSNLIIAVGTRDGTNRPIDKIELETSPAFRTIPTTVHRPDRLSSCTPASSTTEPETRLSGTFEDTGSRCRSEGIEDELLSSLGSKQILRIVFDRSIHIDPR